jgi:hypothetical protein
MKSGIPRKILALLLYILLILGGIRMAWPQVSCALGQSNLTCFYGGIAGVGAGVLIFLGFYLIWIDFIQPILRITRKS